ncbi:MAG: Na/Pi cotransporter family protein [Lachnospiraceae bacterium]
MFILSFFSLLGGLAFFLFGMQVMSRSLERVAGGRLESILKKMTSNPLKALLLGAGITAVIQSSSAMTVMLVGLVNSGIMDISRAVGVIMGSNVGTTITSWLLSLTGIQSDNLFLSLLKPKNFSPVLAFVGILFIMRGSKAKNSAKSADLGTILLGFSILMTGMEFMSSAVEPLADNPSFRQYLTAFSNPLLGVISGAVFTAVIQSSTASVGVLQALALSGSVPYSAAIPIILGQNIGTCITPVLSSIGAGKSAKQVAVLHISFNIIGSALFLALFYGLNAVFHFTFLNFPITPFAIAGFHTVFNISTTLLLLPFSGLLVRLASVLIKPDKNSKETEVTLLDNRLLVAPPLAVDQCRLRTREMAKLSKDAFFMATELLNEYDEKKESEILKKEAELDKLEDALGAFMLQLSAMPLTEEDSGDISILLHTIVDFERIGDRSINIMETARKLHKKQLHFTPRATSELQTMIRAAGDIISLTVQCFNQKDAKLSERVEPLEEVIDMLSSEIKNRHIERLRRGECNAELGIPLNDLLTNLERIGDHCSNIAVCLIQIPSSEYSAHDYLEKIKKGENPNFVSLLNEYSEKYRL